MDWQTPVVMVMVVASALFVMQRQWPQAVRRMRVALALALLRARSERVKALGRRIAPPRAASNACGGCASGCSTG